MLCTNHPKILQFYENHAPLDFEETNLLMVDLLSNIFSQIPTQKLDENSIMSMLSQISKKCSTMETSMETVSTQQTVLKTDISNLQSNVVDSLSLQLYNTKDIYIKELEKFLQSGKTSDMQVQQDLANKQLDATLDKIQLLIGDKCVHPLTSQLKLFQTTLHDEFKKTIQSSTQPNLINSFEANINSKYDHLQQTIFLLSKELHKLDFTDDISTIKTHFERQKNSSNKGSDGEAKLEGVLHELFPSATIENTTGKSKSGDFIVQRNDYAQIMFENKDYANNIPVSEIDKFIRDIDNLNMHGIFLSQKSGISRKDDFHIDVHNGKVILFVHHVNYSHDKIKVAVSMLDHLVSKLDQLDTNGDVIAEETLISINKEFTFFLQQRLTLLELVKKFNKDINKQIGDLTLPELTMLLSTKFASSEAVPFQCSTCNQVYKNAKALAAHAKKCQPVL